MGMVGKLAGAGDQIESVGRVTVNLLMAGGRGGPGHHDHQAKGGEGSSTAMEGMVESRLESIMSMPQKNVEFSRTNGLFRNDQCEWSERIRPGEHS